MNTVDETKVAALQVMGLPTPLTFNQRIRSECGLAWGITWANLGKMIKLSGLYVKYLLALRAPARPLRTCQNAQFYYLLRATCSGEQVKMSRNDGSTGAFV